MLELLKALSCVVCFRTIRAAARFGVYAIGNEHNRIGETNEIITNELNILLVESVDNVLYISRKPLFALNLDSPVFLHCYEFLIVVGYLAVLPGCLLVDFRVHEHKERLNDIVNVINPIAVNLVNGVQDRNCRLEVAHQLIVVFVHNDRHNPRRIVLLEYVTLRNTVIGSIIREHLVCGVNLHSDTDLVALFV